MNYINKVISRIEKDRDIVLGFDIDEFTKKGMVAVVWGLLRIDGKWCVQIGMNYGLCNIEEISLTQYMEKTKDIK